MTLYYKTKIENEKIILVNQDFYKKSGDMIELFILEEKKAFSHNFEYRFSKKGKHIIKLKFQNYIEMERMFDECKSLLKVEGTLKSKSDNFYGMFRNCLFLKEISYLKLETSNKDGLSFNFNSMFCNCSLLKNIDEFQFSNIKVGNSDLMFKDCSSLQNLNVLIKLNTSNMTSLTEVFKNCSSLESLSFLKEWNASGVKYFNNIFEGCSSIQNLDDLKEWNILNAIELKGLFKNCSSL